MMLRTRWCSCTHYSLPRSAQARLHGRRCVAPCCADTRCCLYLNYYTLSTCSCRPWSSSRHPCLNPTTCASPATRRPRAAAGPDSARPACPQCSTAAQALWPPTHPPSAHTAHRSTLRRAVPRIRRSNPFWHARAWHVPVNKSRAGWFSGHDGAMPSPHTMELFTQVGTHAGAGHVLNSIVCASCLKQLFSLQSP